MMTRRKMDKTSESKLPAELEDILSKISKFVGWVAKIMGDTSDFIIRLNKRIVEAILNMARSFVRWATRTIKIMVSFVTELFGIFWSARKQFATYILFYTPSLIL